MTTETLEAWAIVELFGHQRVAGRISDHAFGGETFVRVDIPKDGSYYTRLFGKGAIYCINLTDEAAARAAANAFVSKPTYAYELESSVRRLQPPNGSGQGGDEEESAAADEDLFS
jgi:hypothetical protein